MSAEKVSNSIDVLYVNKNLTSDSVNLLEYTYNHRLGAIGISCPVT